MTAKKHPGDFYRVAKQVADEYPVVEGTRCVQVKIPDDTSFLPVLAAMVASLGNTWSSIGGVEARRLWAEMWQRAYAETDWSGCMNCEELIACLTPILEAQTEAILSQMQNFQQFGTGEPGQPMTEEQETANLAGTTNPDCDRDILWAQCLALVQFTNRQIEDILERIEAATNVVELAGLSDDLPLVGVVLKFFGVELATNTINYFQEALQEGYLAEYTADKEIELACELFCAFRDDCSLTVVGIYDIMWGNVTDEVPDSPIEFIELLALLAGIDVAADTVVDLMFWAMWGMARLGEIMLAPINPGVTLQQLASLAVDDASPDWIILCDCGADWFHVITDTDSSAIVTFPPPPFGILAGTTITQQTQTLFSQDVTGIYMELVFAAPVNLTALRIICTESVNIDTADIVNAFWSLLDASNNILHSGGLPHENGGWEIFETFDVSNVRKVVIQYLWLGNDQLVEFDPVTLFGFGIDPFL